MSEINYNKCPRTGCNGTLEYSNCYDKITGKIIYRCYRCGHQFIIKESFEDISHRDTGMIS